MQKTNWNITQDFWEYKIETALFTYDENERQEHLIDKMNAEIVLNPQFIPLNPRMLQEWYSFVEASIFWFLQFFLTNNEKFYCTNEQIGRMLNVNEKTISLAINKLKEKWLIDLTYKMRGGGWKIRFIHLAKLPKVIHDITKSNVATLPKHTNIENNIIENKNIIYSENQKQENSQEQPQVNNNSFPKQDIMDDAHHSGCDLTNYNFDTFWKEFPHARKGKKKESEQYFNKQDAELVKKQVGILNFKINAWLQDAQFIPACERRIRDFTPISDVVLKQELLKIARWHLNAWGDIKARAKQLKETFGEDAINEAVKTIQQKDSPKNLFINK